MTDGLLLAPLQQDALEGADSAGRNDAGFGVECDPEAVVADQFGSVELARCVLHDLTAQIIQGRSR